MRTRARTHGSRQTRRTNATGIGVLPLAVLCFFLWALVPCLLAAIIATTAESLIGASAQDRFRLLTNELVNWIMTLIGAVAGVGIAMLGGAV